MIPQIIAHRGESVSRPENTLAAFLKALEDRIDIIELDVQTTLDGEVVVIHDPTVDRTTDGHGRVGQLELTALQRLSAGCPASFGRRFHDERISTLAEVLAFLKGRARVMIEIKPDSVREGDETIERGTVEAVRRQAMEEEVVVISFDRRALDRCRRLAPAIPRGAIFHQGRPQELVTLAQQVEATFVLPERRLVTGELGGLARSAGLAVATWVVDDADDLPALLSHDLFGIASNRPGFLRDALQRLIVPT